MGDIRGRRSTRGRRGIATVAALAAFVAALLATTPSVGGSLLAGCTYVEAGPAGPVGNVLRVEDLTRGVVHIYAAADDEIIVFSNAADRLSCTGGTPTVLNVDRIEITTDSAPFIRPLGPGATPEPGAAEIEVHVHETSGPPVLNVIGTEGADSVAIGRLGRHRVGVNANAQADGSAQDADMILDAPRPARAAVKVNGGSGPDRLSALGRAGFSGIFPADHLTLVGGSEDDVLIGGPHDDRLVGGTGNDLMLGGRGRDRFTVGPGRDLVRAGRGPDEIFNVSDVGGIPEDRGPDRIFGGPGNDHVEVLQGLAGDLIHCGRGRHDRAGVDPGDRTRACERVERISR